VAPIVVVLGVVLAHSCGVVDAIEANLVLEQFDVNVTVAARIQSLEARVDDQVATGILGTPRVDIG